MKTIAVFGGSFNPPGLHHRKIAEELTRHFDEVLVVPCGPRPDKQSTSDVEPIYRAAMTDLTFRGMARVHVELFDLEKASFTRTHQLQTMFEHLGELWHVVGGDLITDGHRKDSFIHRVWERGEYIWKHFNFATVTRSGIELRPEDLPPRHRLIELDVEGSSSEIRERIFKRKSITGLVTTEVEAYIERYGLYRGRIPNKTTRLSLNSPRLLIVCDEHNPKAVELLSSFEPYRASNPNAILVIGGDGTMLRAIRRYWPMRLPFIGVNAGHIGFLLNTPSELLNGSFPDLILRQLPMLYVEIEHEDGRVQNALAFNDAWVERATSQTAWIELRLNGSVKISKMISDGALVSTPAGSTAYARAMGAQPLLADTQALILAGSNVLSPPGWKSVLLSADAEIEFRALDPVKRPISAYVDGEGHGTAVAMRVRTSRIATVELAFCPRHDMAEKIAMIQFQGTN